MDSSAISYLVPFLITSKLLWMLLQAYGGLLPFFELITSSKGKYLALYTWATSEPGFWRILQPCLASIARLKEGLVYPNPTYSKQHSLFKLAPLHYISLHQIFPCNYLVCRKRWAYVWAKGTTFFFFFFFIFFFFMGVPPKPPSPLRGMWT